MIGRFVRVLHSKSNLINCAGGGKTNSFLPFVKPIKVFDEKYFVSRHPNKEIVFFWTKVSCKKEYTK
ncbi:hypothetical protein CWM22_10175 [Streptococcus suis]|nr:hypothetical protein CWM22_10175 [Streptococcus suis]